MESDIIIVINILLAHAYVWADWIILFIFTNQSLVQQYGPDYDSIILFSGITQIDSVCDSSGNYDNDYNNKLIRFW